MLNVGKGILQTELAEDPYIFALELHIARGVHEGTACSCWFVLFALC